MTDESIKKYIEAVPEHRRERFQSLQLLILQLYPDAKVSFRYKMPTFEWRDGWVALANQKNYISLYTCGAHHLENFKSKHPDIKTGKGCINFKDKDDIPLADLNSVIHSAMSSQVH